MRDAVHDGAEDDRRDQHPDRLDEGVAERLHLGACLGTGDPKHDAGCHGDEHLDPELPPPGAAARLVDR
ncbi:peptidoglycan/xylan/chitin deacetylase (PgdA/CDA1 family) [Bradyrhizobium sp. LM2.7]